MLLDDCSWYKFKVYPNSQMSSQALFKDQEVHEPNQSSSEAFSEKQKGEDQPVAFFELYRFADRNDKILIFLGIVISFITGCGFPFFGYIWGKVTDSYALPTLQQTVEEAEHFRNIFLYVGAGTLVAGWISFACWVIVGQRMALKCRKAYLESLLKQQMGFYDVTSEYRISSQFESDTISYQRAIGEKVGSLIMIFGMFVCGTAIAFAVRWIITLIIFAAFPFLAVSGFLFIYLIEKKNKNFVKFYEKAGNRSEEAISAIKTVKMLNGQQHEYSLFKQALKLIAAKVPRYSLYGGIGSGLFYISQFFAYAWAFWYGSHCAEDTDVCPVSVTGSRYTAGEVVSVFFALFVGSYNFMQLVPSIQKIYGGMISAGRLYEIIDRVPQIQSKENGKRIDNLKGIITFENVTFSYPKNKSAKILNNLNLLIDSHGEGSKNHITYEGEEKVAKSNKFCGFGGRSKQGHERNHNVTGLSSEGNSNALVGESGCGKSTILQLIMRFYDPDQGRVLVDGVDIKELDLEWFRTQIGYVGQEPVLFATTIKENIKYGKPDATDEEVIEALKRAEAYEFVQELEDKENTYVGYGGGQLSGGQKQRIAIARAIIRNPKIFILDEATSALDRKNERLIQETLNTLVAGRTSITVAHRVKTIMNCNKIYVLHRGTLQEQGTFSSLKRYQGYREEKEQEDKSTSRLKAIADAEYEEASDDEADIYIEGEPIVKDKNLSRQERMQFEEEEIRKRYSKGIYSRLFSYTGGERLKLLLGSISAIIAGALYPVFTIFLAQMVIGTFELNDGNNNNNSQARDDVDRNGLIIVLIGVLSFFVNLLEYFLFSVVGEKVTERIRLEAYIKVLRMPVAWFDLPRNSGPAVAGRLSIDSQLVNGLTSLLFAVMLHNLATIIAAFVISFVFQWRVGLLGLLFLPLMLLAGFISMLFYGGFGDKSEEVYKASSQLVSESVMNIKTVKALGYEKSLVDRYDGYLVEPKKFAFKKGNIIGFLFGLSQFIIFLSFAILFWAGALIRRDNADVEVIDIFTAIFAIVWAGWTAGNNFFFMPDLVQGERSAANIFHLLDRRDEEQCQVVEKSKLLKSGIRGDIRFSDVSFRYPSRNQYVFRHIDLTVAEGDKIALVGPSGCGKSTIINLLLRFYNPNRGSVYINGENIKDYDIHYLRSCFGVVGQEPVLFSGSFEDNIRYNTEGVSFTDIREASKKANALSFIESEEETHRGKKGSQNSKTDGRVGFNKDVGMRGSHISGGQKQRVAIARAILKNPQILLLDEATSALDSQNEKIVQESLDEIMKGKTSVNIAHRIETIKNSKEINVFNKGRIVERGSYRELISKREFFYRLERGIDFQ